MLLFNPVLTGNRKFLTIFQNISCYCLTCTKLIRHTAQHISKHLMLLFNFFNAFPSLLIPLFQNISCYCLTIHTFLHPADLYIFQNISCYCLTLRNSADNLKKYLFQNISCYCLTNDFTSFFNGLF